MFKRRIVVSFAIIVAIIIGSIVDNFTGFGKGYFAISFAALGTGYWLVEFLIDLIYYYFGYDEDFKIFVAEKINKTNLSYEDIMAKKKYYYKEFKRTKSKGKFFEFVKVFFAMGLFIFLVVCLF